MKEMHALLTKLTERFPPSPGSGGHKVGLTGGFLSVAMFRDKVYSYILEEDDLTRSADELFNVIAGLHLAQLASEAKNFHVWVSADDGSEYCLSVEPMTREQALRFRRAQPSVTGTYLEIRETVCL